MSDLIRIIVVIANIAMICLASVWAYSSNFEFEPVISTIGLFITLISFLKVNSSAQKKDNKPSGAYTNLFLVFVMAGLIAFSGYWYYNSRIQPRKMVLLEKMLVSAFAEDVEFMAGMLTLFCDEDFEILKAYTLVRYSDDLEGEEEEEVLAGALGMIKNAPNQLAKAKPKNSFQALIKEKLLKVLDEEKDKIEEITSFESVEDQAIFEALGEQFAAEFKNVDFEQYMDEKLSNVMSSMADEYAENKIITLLALNDFENLGSSPEEVALVNRLLELGHNVALNNEDYQQADESGPCLQMLRDDFKNFLVQLMVQD